MPSAHSLRLHLLEENPNTKMVKAPIHLHEEILTEIFSRLDAKSVGKCRCLSKTWSSRLSTSYFINLHLSRKTNNQENLILISAFTDTLHTIVSPITDDVVSTNLELLPGTWFKVLGSCNGLVLLEASDEEGMFLVNPVTQQQVKIPENLNEHDGIELLRFGFVGDVGLKVFGFGYDSSSDDYKIVTLSYYVLEDRIYALVDVFYVKLGVWRRLDIYRPNHKEPLFSKGAFVNGSIHWLSSNRESGFPTMIVGFDVKDEVFREVPAPPNVYDGAFPGGNRLCVFEGCLCMVDSSCGINIWVMKEYGVVGSWTKLRVRPRGAWDIYKPLCFISGGEKEIVLLTDDHVVVVYNLKTRTTKELAVDGDIADFFEGGTFVDSLVSPFQSDGVNQ